MSMFVASALLFAAFYLVQRRLGERAMLRLTLFRNVTFNGISAVTLLCAAATMSALFLQISYVQNVLGFSAWDTGLRFLPLTLTLFVAAAIAGNLTTRMPQRVLVGFAMSFVALGLALVLLVDADSSWTSLLPSMFGLGLGMGLFNPPRASLSIAVAEPAEAGMASGIGETFQQVGVAVGIAAFGALFQSRVTDLFVDSEAGRQLGGKAQEFGEAVAAGGGSQAAAGMPATIAERLDQAARTAFADGLHEVMIVCASIAALGALIAFAFIRTRDLHESALTGAESEGARAGTAVEAAAADATGKVSARA